VFDIDGAMVSTDGPGSGIRADTASVARVPRAGSDLSALERVRQDQEDANRAQAVSVVILF